MERDSLSTFPHFLFINSLSIHLLYRNCIILSQNVKYSTFVANVTKNLSYALWENNSGSNSLRGSSASCAGLPWISKVLQIKLIYPTLSKSPTQLYWTENLEDDILGQCHQAQLGWADNFIVVYIIYTFDVNVEQMSWGVRLKQLVCLCPQLLQVN